MSRHKAHHPIQVALEEIWGRGHTPRIQVDARREGVVVPEHVRTKWGARLVLDLDASWPLNIAFDSKGIEVDLAFQGHVCRCTLPWESIYVVVDRATGRGFLIESHVPRDIESHVPRDPEPSPPQAVVGKRPREPRRLEVVGAGASTVPSSARPAAAAASNGEPVSPTPEHGSAGAPNAESGTDGEAPRERPTSEEEAKRRRALFRVIDGGR
jgi:stringent starvation protein B